MKCNDASRADYRGQFLILTTILSTIVRLHGSGSLAVRSYRRISELRRGDPDDAVESHLAAHLLTVLSVFTTIKSNQSCHLLV